MKRLENQKLFEAFIRQETKIANERPILDTNVSPDAHSWLKRLSVKNGLSSSANTVYLLHGTRRANLEQISREGLRVKHAKPSSLYGQGVYFTESSCKAAQYGDGGVSGGQGCILICRVALGTAEKLATSNKGAKKASGHFHSAVALKGYTCKGFGSNTQLHSEFIVFDDAAIYPEFALIVDIDS